MEESKQAFDEFLEVVRNGVEHGDDLVAMLQRRYAGTNPHFLWNREFIYTVKECQRQILNNKDKSYVHLAQFNKTLKEYATKPLKHLLGKNGTSKIPEFADDIRCEKLLNSLAKQQKKSSSVVENSSPPFKRQRLLGVNENNEVIVIDDQLSEPVAQNLKSSPARVVSPRGKAGTDGVGGSQMAAPANGYVASVDLPTKPAPLPNQHPPSSDQTSAAVEVICIDDDDDDVSEGCGNVPLNCAEHAVTPIEPKTHTDVVVTAESLSTDCRSSISDCAVIVDDEETPLPSLSQQVADSRSSTSSAVNEQQQTSVTSPAASSLHSSPSSRKVERLENLLKKLSDKIKKLRESELTLDDMDSEDTSYVLEEKFTQKFVKVWEKLCKIKNRPVSTGRIVERKFVCELERYPKLADRISHFVNKNRCFPDYQDILSIVKDWREHNPSHESLGHFTAETLARDIFKVVGGKLQQQRLQDFVENFGSHLTDDYRPGEDPALTDTELQKQLYDNLAAGRKRLNEVINEFVQKQLHEGDHTDDGEDEEHDDVDDGDGSSDVEIVDTADVPTDGNVASVSMSAGDKGTNESAADKAVSASVSAVDKTSSVSLLTADKVKSAVVSLANKAGSASVSVDDKASSAIVLTADKVNSAVVSLANKANSASVLPADKADSISVLAANRAGSASVSLANKANTASVLAADKAGSADKASSNVSVADKSSSASVSAGELTHRGADNVGYEWSVNISSSSESEDDDLPVKRCGNKTRQLTEYGAADTTVLLIDDDDDDSAL